MKLKDLTRTLDKLQVYDSYLLFIDEPKEYDNITKNQMYMEVWQLYENDLELFTKALSLEEFHFLNELYEGKAIEKQDEFTFLDHLRSKFLLGLSNTYDYLIPDELSPLLQKAVTTLTYRQFKRMDERNQLILGLLRTYGPLPLEDLAYFFLRYLPIGEDAFIEHLFENIYLKDYISSYEDDKGTLFFCVDEFYEVQDMILELRHNYTPIVGERKKEELLRIGKEIVDISHPDIKAALDAYQQIAKFPHLKSFKQSLLIQATLTKKEFEAPNDLSHHCDEGTYAHFLSLCNKAIQAIPSAVYYGCNAIEYQKALDHKNAKAIQKKAHLSKTEKDLFFELYFALLEFTNQRSHIEPSLKKIYRQKNLEYNKIAVIRDYLFDHREYIDQFIEENPYHFNEEQCNLIYEFHHARKGQGFILRYLPACTIINIDGEGYFEVLGLTSNIEEIIPPEQLPAMGEFVLLPWRDHIIYDGLLMSYPIKVGKGMKKTMEEEYEQKKASKRLTRFDA